MEKLLIFQLIFAFGIINAFAQKDSLIFKNGNYIVGEVKSMDRNTLKVKTDYSDDDFTIEWDGVKEIYTKTFYLITLSDGTRYNGTLKSTGPKKIAILTDDGKTVNVDAHQIVLLDDVDTSFWSQVYASIDFGFDLAKAQNSKQLSMRSNLGYIAKRWQMDGAYNTLYMKQEQVADIKRIDGALTYKFFLPHDWYPMISLEFLSNTEQQLDLRTTGKLGLGKYIIHTNKIYWGFSGGLNYNNENYSAPDFSDRKSWEGYLGSELNFFNVGDLSLLTSLIAYPSFTESGRWRSDFKFDTKYDLPLDLYVKLGYTLNFDNQPAAGAPNTDYVLHTGFGWEW